MLIEHKLSNLAKLGGGMLHGEDLSFKEISTDTRTIKQGDVFLALKGRNFDGEDYCKDAIKKGAICIISEKNHKQISTFIKVPSTFSFLKKLAEIQRKLFRKPVIAITGSNGKTSTKEILYKILDKYFSKKIFKSPGNWNNELGVYYSLLGLTHYHRIAIFEIGTSAPGEIKELSAFLNPDIGIITNIGNSHLEGLLSIEGVMREKTDLFESVDKNGICLIRTKEEFLPSIKEKSKNKKLIILDESEELSFDQNIEMALKTTSCLSNKINENCNPSESTIESIKKSFSVPGRQEIMIGKNNVTIMNDTYNANPESFKDAFRKIKSLKFKNKICVMGKMGELGEKSNSYQDQVISLSSEIFDLVFALDIETNLSYKNLKLINASEIENLLLDHLNEDSIVLFKASRSVRMEGIVKLFL